MSKPFSPACERNKASILEQISPILKHTELVLEVGSGTGQHGIFFSQALRHLNWQMSDREEAMDGLRANWRDAQFENLLPPTVLDVNQVEWPAGFDCVFTANTLHIMPWISVTVLIQQVGTRLPQNGLFIIYGPFNYGGEFTSPSNGDFDKWLKAQRPHQGVREYEACIEVAESVGLTLEHDISMPANNQLLVLRKS